MKNDTDSANFRYTAKKNVRKRVFPFETFTEYSTYNYDFQEIENIKNLCFYKIHKVGNFQKSLEKYLVYAA